MPTIDRVHGVNADKPHAYAHTTARPAAPMQHACSTPAKRAPTGAALAAKTRADDAREMSRQIVLAGLCVVAGAPVVAFIEGYAVSIVFMVAPFALGALAYVARKVA